MPRSNRLWAALFLALPLAAQDGLDVSTAVPITFGQTVADIMDATTRPRQVYKITMARGQRFAATLTVPAERPAANLGLHLFAPGTRSLANMSCGDPNAELIYRYARGARAASFDYLVAAAGDYYLVACPYQSTGVQYRLQVDAEGGVPIVTPLPAQAGCVFGEVDFIEYSLRLIAVGLPDRVGIGGTEICERCNIKPPLYEPVVRKLELAMRSNLKAEACYDDKGNIFKVKLQR